MQGEVFFTSPFSVVGMFILQLFRGEGEGHLRQLKEKKIDKKGDINYGDSESEDCPGVY